MSRILEKNGVNNTNIDGASFNNFCAGQRSGIIKGRLNECAITTPSSSVINIETGELLVSGVRVVLNNPKNFTFSTFPSSATRYSLIAEIVIDSNSDITSRIFVQLANTGLVQNDLFKTENGSGTYQIELAKFTLTQNGVEDLIRTVDIITGGMGGDGVHWEVGEITTEKLAPDLNAEVDIDYNEDTKKYDFNFALPEANNVVSVLKTSTTGLIDTYTITFMNGETKTFDVKNGNGIASIAKTGTVDNVDTYTITFTDGTTTTFQIINSMTAEEKEKISKIIINGDGKKALLNDGTYGEVGTVDTVNNVLPDENKNITITADDISDEETTNKFATAEELAQIATNTNNINVLETNKADKATTISGYGITDAYTKTEIESKIASVYKYKGSVANYASLPTTDLTIGDVYNVEDTGDNYAWTGTEWDKLAGTIDLSNYATKVVVAQGQGLYRSATGTGEVDTPVYITQTSAAANTVAKRTSTGAIFTATATDNAHAVNKLQMDTAIQTAIQSSWGGSY